MSSKNFTWPAALLMVLTLACPAPARNIKSQTPPFKITALRAKLFYESSGAFSKDILADPNISLWNTIIGEGDAGGASSSTLIIVEVTGKPGAYESTCKIEFTATYKQNGQNSRETVVRRTTETGILNTNGKFYAAFWLYETGCYPVKLAARLIGQTQPSVIKRTINFQCGE